MCRMLYVCIYVCVCARACMCMYVCMCLYKRESVCVCSLFNDAIQ
jgi:hypothetical protein